jgi:hypothetical protein
MPTHPESIVMAACAALQPFAHNEALVGTMTAEQPDSKSKHPANSFSETHTHFGCFFFNEMESSTCNKKLATSACP